MTAPSETADTGVSEPLGLTETGGSFTTPGDNKPSSGLRSKHRSLTCGNDCETPRKSVRFVDEALGQDLEVICFTEESFDWKPKKTSQSCCTLS